MNRFLLATGLNVIMIDLFLSAFFLLQHHMPSSVGATAAAALLCGIAMAVSIRFRERYVDHSPTTPRLFNSVKTFLQWVVLYCLIFEFPFLLYYFLRWEPMSTSDWIFNVVLWGALTIAGDVMNRRKVSRQSGA